MIRLHLTPRRGHWGRYRRQLEMLEGLRIRVKALLLGIVLALSSTHTAGASSQSEGEVAVHRSFWVDLGLGLGTMTSSKGLCWRVGCSFEMQRHVLSARLFEVSQVTISGVEPRSPQPAESATEVALMYGFDVSSKRDIFLLSVGIGYVHLRQRGKLLPNSPSGYVYESRIAKCIGVALDLRVLVPMSDRMAVGLSGVGNINASAFVGGGMITLAFGGFP
jgi:hypothetical protein